MSTSYQLIDTSSSPSATPSSALITNSNDDHGLVIHILAGSLGDDDNRASLEIIAVNDDEAASQAYFRVDDIVPNDTTIVAFFPGITPIAETVNVQRSAVLPPKWQVQMSSVMSLDLAVTVTATTLK